MSWTPGPWVWDQGPKDEAKAFIGLYGRRECVLDYLHCGSHRVGVYDPVDARLIAKAPQVADLLDYLSSYASSGHTLDDSPERWRSRLREARSLLAEIKGETS